MKYVKKKLIKGKVYYYFEYPLTIAGKKRTFTKYLGVGIPLNLPELFNQFFVEIAQLVASTVDKGGYFPPNGALAIESARFRYVALNHELFQKDLQLFRTLFYILFVLNSNRAEGSKVTRPEIEEIMARRVKPRTIIEKEIVNSIDAINFALSDKMKWNAKRLKMIHKFLFSNIHPEIAGRYKLVNNVIGNATTTPWHEVPVAMKALLAWLHANRKMYPPRLALEFYWRFEAIHPFEDGNGRVGRILLNAILIEQGYAPIVFFSQNHGAHCSAIEKARHGRTVHIAKHFVTSMKKTEDAVSRYKEEGVITGGSKAVGQWEIQKGKIRLF